MEGIPTPIIAALLAIVGIQYLKNSSWFPGVAKGNDKINAVFGVLVAALAASGIGYETIADPTTGTYGFMAHGLTMASISKFAWAVAQQWIMQHVGWKVLKGVL